MKQRDYNDGLSSSVLGIAFCALFVSLMASTTHAQSSNVNPTKDIYSLKEITATPPTPNELKLQLDTSFDKKKTVAGTPGTAPVDSDISWSADKGGPVFDSSTGASVKLDFTNPFTKDPSTSAKQVTITATYSGSSDVEDSPRTKTRDLVYLDFWIAETEDQNDDVLIVRPQGSQLGANDKKVIHWSKVVVKHSLSGSLPLKLTSTGAQQLYFYGNSNDPNRLSSDPTLDTELTKDFAADAWFWIGTDAQGSGQGKFKATGDLGSGYKDAPEEKTVSLLHVEVVDKNKAAVSKLKVGKMSETGVLTGTGASATLDIDKDSDRFFIRLPGGAAMGGIFVKVSTTDNPDGTYNDNATQIDLVTDGTDAISKSMLLVSDDVDDDYAADGIADDATDDRTHKIQLGGNFKIEAIKIGAGGWQNMDNKTPVPARKKIKCDVFVLKVGGTAVRTNAQVEKEMKIIQERFAQVAVSFNYVITEKDQPAGVDLSDGLTVAGANPAVWKKISSETRSLIVGLGTVGSASDVQIFYVNQVNAWGSNPRGAALADYWFDESEEDYINNVIAGSPYTFDPFNVAHELGHLLTDDGHASPDTNLMMGNGTPITNTVGASKRLDASQETRILNSDRLSNP